MEISNVRIFLRDQASTAKLKAYATITLDDVFVVRKLKVIEGSKGLFVAMPSERMKESCPKCGHRNVLHSRFCNQCGAAVPAGAPKPRPTPEGGAAHESQEAQSEHRDIAHPITAQCRETVQKKVLEAYEAARSQAGQPNPA